MTRTPDSLGPALLATLAECGPLRVGDIHLLLHVRRQTLLRALSALFAAGQIVKSRPVRLGADGRPRRVSVYHLPGERSDAGSCAADDGSRSVGQPKSSAAAAIVAKPAAATCVACGSILSGGGGSGKVNGARPLERPP